MSVRMCWLVLALSASAPACTTACSNGATGQRSLEASSTRPVIRITGSDTMVNLVQAWAENYAKVRPAVSVQVAGGGSGVGIAGLIEGVLDIAAAGEQVKASETQLATARNGSAPRNSPSRWMLYFVALVVFLYDATGSAGWVAAAAVVRMLAYVFLSPFGGVVADRFDRRRLMISLDLVRALVMGALAMVAWSEGPPVLAIALTVVCSIATVPHRPACVTATPALVAEDDLAAANAAESIVGQISYFVGPALGALVVAVADPGTAFLVNGLTFLASAALVTKAGHLGGGGAGMKGRERTAIVDADADRR